MIWFTCKKCGKKHGRADNLVRHAGLLRLRPGQHGAVAEHHDGARDAAGTAAPTPTAAASPSRQPRPGLGSTAAAPLPYDDDEWDNRRRPSGPMPLPLDDASAGDLLRRRRAQVFRRRRPGFCLNHDDVATDKTCAECKESFCPNCVVELQGKTLCGPCKNFLVRGLHRPGKVPPLAIVAVIVGLVSSPVTFCLTLFGSGQMGGVGAVVLSLIGLAHPGRRPGGERDGPAADRIAAEPGRPRPGHDRRDQLAGRGAVVPDRGVPGHPAHDAGLIGRKRDPSWRYVLPAITRSPTTASGSAPAARTAASRCTSRRGASAGRCREGEGACGVHPECESVGPCGRCGKFMCETCRTKWRDQILCAACVDRAMESKEAAPEQSRTQLRQAILALGMGDRRLGAVPGGLPRRRLGVAASGGRLDGGDRSGVLLAMVALLAAAGVALFGIGQAAAVLRARGSHMILATIGLVVGGSVRRRVHRPVRRLHLPERVIAAPSGRGFHALGDRNTSQGGRRRAGPRRRGIRPADAPPGRLGRGQRDGPRLAAGRAVDARSGRPADARTAGRSPGGNRRSRSVERTSAHARRPAGDGAVQARRDGPGGAERGGRRPRPGRDGRFRAQLSPLLRAAVVAGSEGGAVPQGAGQRGDRAGRRGAADAGASDGRRALPLPARHRAAARPGRRGLAAS